MKIKENAKIDKNLDLWRTKKTTCKRKRKKKRKRQITVEYEGDGGAN